MKEISVVFPAPLFQQRGESSNGLPVLVYPDPKRVMPI